jgi:DNA primase
MHELLVGSPEAKHARAYLRGRGYGKEMAERWLVGWMPRNPSQFLQWAKEEGFSGRELCGTGMASPKDEQNPRAGLYLRFRDRLMFPIHNDYGDIIAFSGRQLVEDKNSGKYINSPETALFKKSRVFFGLQKAKRPIGQEKFALICEGQIDVIACHEGGFENAIAGLGTALTADHARLLKRYTDTAILCYDSDAAGHKAISKAFSELTPAGLEVRVAPLPEKEDPDSLLKSQGSEAFRALLDNASGFFDYQIDFAQKNADLNQPQNRTKLAHTLATHLKIIPDSVAADSLTAHCATRLGIGLPEFRQAIAKVREPRSYPSRQDDNQPAPVRPASYHSSILFLCQLALQSPDAQQWLYEQTESLLETIASTPGSGTLARILSQRPRPGESASINSFLSDLDPAHSLTVSATLENPTPEDPIAHASRALDFLARQSLKHRSNEIASLLHSPNLEPERVQSLLQEAREISAALRDSNNP